MRHHSINASALLLLVIGCTVGCGMTAPMHVWKKPKLATGGSVRVALAPVGGTSEVAEKLEQAMVVARPQAMQQLAVFYPDQLEQVSGIQLAAFDGQPSEMGSFGAAKRVGAEYLMTAVNFLRSIRAAVMPK